MMTAASGWEHFGHGADVGVRGYGATEAEAFAQAARALVAVVVVEAGHRAGLTRKVARPRPLVCMKG